MKSDLLTRDFRCCWRWRYDVLHSTGPILIVAGAFQCVNKILVFYDDISPGACYLYDDDTSPGGCYLVNRVMIADAETIWPIVRKSFDTLQLSLEFFNKFGGGKALTLFCVEFHAPIPVDAKLRTKLKFKLGDQGSVLVDMESLIGDLIQNAL